MKKIMILIAFMLAMIGVSWAQNTPVVDARQQNQKSRIRQGIVSGEVTRAEAAKLRSGQRHIKRAERRAKADGEVTERERMKLQRKQDRASRGISTQKRDIQDRPRAN